MHACLHMDVCGIVSVCPGCGKAMSDILSSKLQGKSAACTDTFCSFLPTSGTSHVRGSNSRGCTVSGLD